MERDPSEPPSGLRLRRTDGALVLVVEDNEDFRLLLELTLRDAGYAVDCATSSEEAIQLLETRTYHLVLSDYSLPGLSGAWLVSQAAARCTDAPVPSVIITGDPDAPGIPCGIAVVAKPVDFERLLGDIRALLGSSACPTQRDIGEQAAAAGESDTFSSVRRARPAPDAFEDFHSN